MAETTAGAPSATQTGIALVDRVIAAVNAATKIDNATSKPETYHVCRKLITNAAGAVLLDAATCDKVERLVQTLHPSALAAEVASGHSLLPALKGSLGGANGAPLLPWPGVGLLCAKLLTTSACVVRGPLVGTEWRLPIRRR